MSKTELLGVLGAEKLTNKSGNNILGHPAISVYTTGCLKKLCFLTITQPPLLLKIQFISFFKNPLNGQFKTIQNFISRCEIHQEIHQNIH